MSSKKIHQMKKSITLSFIIALAAIQSEAKAQSIAIDSARTLGYGQTVTVTGIVTNGSELGAIRYMQDATAGLAVYDATAMAGVHRGDSITVSGILNNYNNLMEMGTVTLTIHATNVALPVAPIITVAQLNEPLEGELVKITGCSFAQAGGTFAGNTSYTVSSMTQNFTIYVRNGSPLIGTTIPTGNVTLRGIVSQFGSVYQLLPRDINDIIVTGNLHIISSVVQSNIVQTGFNLSWMTDSLSSSFVKYGYTPNLELGTLFGNANTANHTVTLTGLQPADIVYAECFSNTGTDTASSSTGLYATQSASSGNIKCYFNLSVNNNVATINNAIQLNHSIDDTLIAYINRAQQTLDMTIYDYNDSLISDIAGAVNAAAARGVRVRFISDGSMHASNNSTLTQLSAAVHQAVSPVPTGYYNIMHNKFVIIDAKNSNPLIPIVWTGSTNWQEEQIDSDPNSVIIYQDQTLAKTYTLEFNEMWGDTGAVYNASTAKWGPDKSDNTPHEFNIGGNRVECYFSPSDNVNSHLIHTINSADVNMDFASMVITRADIAAAITGRVAAGVETFGITNTVTGTTTWNTLRTGMQAGHLIPWCDSANSIMHHKYLLVDQNQASNLDPLVWVGSHNWSNNANVRNDENTTVVHNQAIANQFYQEFYSRFISCGGLITTEIKGLPELNSEFSIYPNPSTNNNVTVLFKNFAGYGKNKNATIIITDITGKIIHQAELTSVAGTNIYNLSIDNIVAGMYFVTIHCEEYNSTQKWVKQ